MPNNEDLRGLHVIVKGRVQGVFFRQQTKSIAISLKIKGSVKNLSDGSVEIYAFGTEASLKDLENWCYKGPPFAKVETVESTSISYQQRRNFQII